jgi:glutathione S-transferase
VNVLWHIELSHYNEKARWALDYKGVPYERRVPMPGLHGPVALAVTHGKQRRLPVLRLDGRVIGDSTAIIAALEQHTPDPPLYPADAADRARALELEDYFDEQLAPEIRRFGWHHMLPDSDAAAGALFRGSSPARERVLRMTFPVARRLTRRDYAIDPDSDAAPRAAILAAMDHLEAELDGGEYLVGGAFSVADLTAASLFTPIVRPPERPFLPEQVVPAIEAFGDELMDRPGGRWILDTYARHRGSYAGAPA